MKKYQEYERISKLLLESEIFRIFVENDGVLDDVNSQTDNKINLEEYILLKKIYNFKENQIILDDYYLQVDLKINNILLSIIQNNNLRLRFDEFLTLENIMLYKKHLILIEVDLDITEISSRFFRKTNFK